MMKIDLHTHTVYGSGCSHINPSDLVEQAKRVGLDGVCFTEHNQLWDPDRIERLSHKHDFLVIGGVEVLTEFGEILVFGLHEPVRWVRHARDLREMVDRAGGFMIAAHPFRGQRLLLDSQPSLDGALTIETGCTLPLLKYVDAMEVFNGWAYRREWQFTMEVSKRLGLKGTGGSDAHKLLQTGVCFTLLERRIQNEQEFIHELKAGRFAAANEPYGFSPTP
ncbi:PHP-associated domain-containing protein [Thermodesulfobacteriota bacterium]